MQQIAPETPTASSLLSQLQIQLLQLAHLHCMSAQLRIINHHLLPLSLSPNCWFRTAPSSHRLCLLSRYLRLRNSILTRNPGKILFPSFQLSQEVELLLRRIRTALSCRNGRPRDHLWEGYVPVALCPEFERRHLSALPVLASNHLLYAECLFGVVYLGFGVYERVVHGFWIQ